MWRRVSCERQQTSKSVPSIKSCGLQTGDVSWRGLRRASLHCGMEWHSILRRFYKRTINRSGQCAGARTAIGWRRATRAGISSTGNRIWTIVACSKVIFDCLFNKGRKHRTTLIQFSSAHKDQPCRGISFSPTDVKFASCSDDGTVRIWDFYTRTEEKILRGHGADVKQGHCVGIFY